MSFESKEVVDSKKRLEHHKVYSGKEFNELTKGQRFVRLTNKTENHNGFQYKTGLNVDHLPFNPVSECRPGGLYFCGYNEFEKFVKYGNINFYYEFV